MASKKEIQKDIDAILRDEIGRDSETDCYMVASVIEKTKNVVVIRFPYGIPNLAVIGALMLYFDVGIDAFHMEGDGDDWSYSEYTQGHDNWIDVTIKLGE